MDWKGFVIVKDGGCTYEEKARNVQAMGAQALLIAEDEKAFVDERINHDSWSKYDGSGTSVHIPTFLVLGAYGEGLINLVQGKSGLLEEEQIILKADIEISN